jgi:hypothetical protein
LLIIKGKDKAGRYIENRIMLGIRRFMRGGTCDHEEETTEQPEAIRLPTLHTIRHAGPFRAVHRVYRAVAG